MAKITLQIVGENSKALESIDKVDKAIKSLQEKPVEIKVVAQGLDAMVSKLKEATAEEIKAAEAAAKKANAEARKINAETRAAESAAKLGKAQKEVAQSTQQASQASDKAAASSEQLVKAYADTARQADYARQKGQELSSSYLQVAQSTQQASQGQLSLVSSTSLIIQNMGLAETSVRGLVSAYQELARASSTGMADYYIPQRRALPGYDVGGGSASGGMSVDRYADAIDVEWRAVADGANAAASAVDNAASSVNNATNSFNSLGEGARTAWARLSEGTPIVDALGDSISNIVVKITTWQVVNGIVASIKRSFKDALETMKEVDSELVTVRKVTGFTADEMKRVEEQAYETASAYGVAANEYLESVAAFARAGYKEQSAALAELSTKTQIVGDTTAEVANQFLLSVDAAYKYEGSIESLTRVLDGANEIDNKYATSIEKIAEGMGIVAPVASQMNVSIDELAAAIGTITAVTQRSGSEAARALRALFLNIAGDTKTEIDEGITWTTGEIEGLRDVVKLYAKDAYDAAQATGSIIDPMRAMEGLAKSMQEGLLTEQQLISMVSDIGGKLRTSQLLAIIQNWDMYQSMLVDYGNALGSADKEVSNALDSWERKTAQLDNAFTQLISHVVDSGAIKAGIDTLTEIVKLLDSGISEVAVLSAGFLAMGKIIAQIGKSNVFNFILQEIIGLTAGTVTATTALADLWALLSASPVVWAVAAAAAIYGLAKAYDALNVTAKEYKEQIDEAVDAYKSAEDEIASLNEQIAENTRLIETSNQAGQDQSYRDRLDQENIKLQEQVEILKERERLSLASAARDAANLAGESYTIHGVGTFDLPSYFKMLEASGGQPFDELVDSILTARDALVLFDEAGGVMSQRMEEALDLFNDIIGDYVDKLRGGEKETDKAGESSKKHAESVREETEEVNVLSDAVENLTGKLSEYNEQINSVQSALQTITSAQEEYNSTGSLSVDTFQTLLQLDKEYLDALIDENGQINLNSAAVSNLIDGKNVLLERLASEAIATYAAEEAERLLTEQTESLNGTLPTTQKRLEDAATAALQSGEDALFAAGAWAVLDNILKDIAGGTGLNELNTETLINNVRGYAADLQSILRNTGKSYKGWSSKGTQEKKDTTKTTTKAEDDPEVVAIKARIQAHKDEIALLKSELELMKAQGASNDELASKMREIQAAEHEYADDLRVVEDHWEELKIDQTDVNALSLDWWKIQNDINDLLEETVELREDELDTIQSAISLEKQNLDFLEESGKSVEEQVAQIKKIQGQLHEEAEIRRANLEVLKESGASASEIADAEAEIVKLSTEWWEYENKINKLLEKQAEEAEKQRKELIKQAKEEALKLLEAEEAAAKGPLQEELELLQAQNEALEDEREEAEKLLAVEKARAALQNAQNERNIRQYNASTAQWEWVANASTVAKAEEDLAKAEQSLADYYAKNEIAALKARINEVGETYDSLRDAVNEFAESVENGTASWNEAESFLLSSIANFGEAVNSSAVSAASAFASIVGGVTGKSTVNSTGGTGSSKAWLNDLPQEQREFYNRLQGGTLQSLNDFIMINGDTVHDWYNVAKGGGNAVEAWRDENGVGDYFRWHAAREGSGQDVVTWLAAGLSAGELTEEQVAEVLTQKIAEGVGSKQDQRALQLGLELLQNGQYYTYYDGGGILRGIGGIKATKQDEMVLPPSATKAMLDAEQNGSFNALLRHLGIVTSVANSYAGFGGTSTTTIGTQNNGDTYQFGNITLSEAQAKSMSVYDLACMAGELSLHNAM